MIHLISAGAAWIDCRKPNLIWVRSPLNELRLSEFRTYSLCIPFASCIASGTALNAVDRGSILPVPAMIRRGGWSLWSLRLHGLFTRSSPILKSHRYRSTALSLHERCRSPRIWRTRQRHFSQDQTCEHTALVFSYMGNLRVYSTCYEIASQLSKIDVFITVSMHSGTKISLHMACGLLNSIRDYCLCAA